MTHEIGLTYPKKFSTNGKEVKDHLHKIKLWFTYHDIQLFWYMEFQKRGAPHFHCVISKEVDEQELKKIWYKIVNSNDPKHLKHGAHINAIRTPKGMLHYLTSYLTKQEQKIVPKNYINIGRFWGYSRSLMEPYIIKIIIGTEKEIRLFRARYIRPIRRWLKSIRRGWHSKRKNKKFINLYSSFMPGDYLTVTEGRKWINELKSRGFDTSLFE